MPLTYPHDFSGMTSITGAQLQAQFDAVSALIGSLTAGDLSASAGILLSQLEASYEHIAIPLRTSFDWYGAAWPGGPLVMDEVTLPFVTGDTPFAVTHISYSCNDTGTDTGKFRVEYGSYSTGAWVQTGWVCADTGIVGAAGNNTTVCGLIAAPYSLAVAAAPRTLRLISTAADAGCMDSTGDTVSVTVFAKRQISAG